MSTVIYALWQAGDPYPLIMPGTVPLSEPRVFDDLTQYLEDSWKSIIDGDVDGVDSTPARIDHEKTLFGQRALTRRIARTIFVGSAATLRSAHKGIDQRGIWLGTAVPGDTVAHFSSALHTLADQATYLYSDAARYWYDTQPSVARMAKDHAERLRDRPDEVWGEIVDRLQPYSRRRRGDFAAVHVAPEGTGDIPDTEEARLVVLHPEYAYRRNGEDSPALTFVREATISRGAAQRRHRNALVFLAPDARRLDELGEAVREYRAWKHIADRVTELNLAPNQAQLAQVRKERADDVVNQRISTTYIWVIFPYQPDPARPMEFSVVKAESQSPELAERVSDKLGREGALAAVHSSRNIHHYLSGPLKALWDRGYISVGELWDLYTTYPYLPRLRDRSVLEDGLRDALNSITWEQEGFALAAGRDETTGRFSGLAIPPHDTFGPITDYVLLVRPDLARHQHAQEESGAPPDGASGPSAGESLRTGEAGGQDRPVTVTEEPSAPAAKTRFFGVFKLDPEKYGRDLTRLQQEILPHLADPEATDLRITVEIEATRPDGFPEDKVRIVGENARVLRFDRSDFE